MKVKIFITFFVVVLGVIIAFVFFLLASNKNNLLTSQANDPQRQLFQFATFGTAKVYPYGTTRQQQILTLSAFLVDKKIDSKSQITLTVFIPQKESFGQSMKIVYSTGSTHYFTVFEDNKFGNKQVFEQISNSGLFSKLMIGRQIMFDLDDPNGNLQIRLNSNSHNLLKLIPSFIFPQVEINSGIINTYLGDK